MAVVAGICSYFAAQDHKLGSRSVLFGDPLRSLADALPADGHLRDAGTELDNDSR